MSARREIARNWVTLAALLVSVGGCYASHESPTPDASVRRDARPEDASVRRDARPEDTSVRRDALPLDTSAPPHDTGSVPADVGADTGGEEDELSLAYCECMTRYCFGFPPFDEGLESCLLFADTLPRAGVNTEMGNAIECRLHWCTVHITSFEDAHCGYASGLAVCI